MKILFVDDDREKFKALFPALLSECRLTESDIEFAYDAMQARELLRRQQFDLLILDLLLPLRGIGEPELKHSIDLVKDILGDDDFKKPGSLIGVTRDCNARVHAEPAFQDYLWTIVEVDPTSSEWISKIVNCVSYLVSADAQEVDQQGYLKDVAILTALSSPEMEAVHQVPWAWGVEHPLDRTTMVREGSFISSGRTYSAVCASAPRMGMIATAILATKLIQFARPRFLVMAGICAGVEGRVGMGDVVLADPCWDYQSGKYVVDGQVGSRFDIAPHQIVISEAIRVRIDAMRRDRSVWREIEDRWVAPRPSNGLRLHIGPVASGSAVIADAAQVELVKAQQRQLLGIEMEIYGLLAAAHSANSPKPTAFALKSVCDFADSNKNDSYHAYAAYTSAQAVRAFFERYMHEIQGFAGT